LLFKQDEQIKIKVQNNDLDKEELLSLNQKLIQHNKELKTKLEQISVCEQSVIIFLYYSFIFVIIYLFIIYLSF